MHCWTGTSDFRDYPLGSPTTIMKINAKHSAVVLVAMYGLDAASNSISSSNQHKTWKTEAAKAAKRDVKGCSIIPTPATQGNPSHLRLQHGHRILTTLHRLAFIWTQNLRWSCPRLSYRCIYPCHPSMLLESTTSKKSCLWNGGHTCKPTSLLLSIAFHFWGLALSSWTRCHAHDIHNKTWGKLQQLQTASNMPWIFELSCFAEWHHTTLRCAESKNTSTAGFASSGFCYRNCTGIGMWPVYTIYIYIYVHIFIWCALRISPCKDAWVSCFTDAQVS